MKARSLRVFLALIVSLLGLGATNAYASHYRYGTMYWEKDLTYTNPGFYKVRVTVLIGARWGFAWVILADAPPSTNRCAGTPVFGDSPSGGSCPPIGAKINMTGGGTGYIGLDKAPAGTSVTIVKGYRAGQTVFTGGGTAIPAPYGALNPAPFRFSHDAEVVEITPTTDTLYAELTFDLIYPISANPITVNHWQLSRLSSIRENNNDQAYQLTMTIDASAPRTKSPRSASFPVLSATTGVNNDFLLPLTTFDNGVGSVRFSTAAESSLFKTVPTNMTIDAATPDLVHWTPPAAGLYAVQFMLQSTIPGIATPLEAPLDLLLNATPACAESATCPTVTTSVPGGQTTLEAQVGTPLSQPIYVDVTPFTTGSTVSLANTPLTAGMTLTPTSSSATPLIANLNWTPTATSPENNIVCFQGGVTLPGTSTLRASPGMLCLTIHVTDPGNLPPVLTCAAPMTVEATSLSGALVNLSATVSEPNQQSTTVTWTEGGTTLGTGTTAADVASEVETLGHTFSIGSHTILTTAFDGKNTGSCTTSLDVTKKQQTVTFTSSSANLAVGASRALTATSGVSPIAFSIAAGPGSLAPPDTLTATGVGLIEVKASAPADGLYAAGDVIQQIQTYDGTAPTIAAHADVNAEATSATGAQVTYVAPATSDDVDAAGTATCSPASGGQFAIGSTPVTCNASDAAGNAATATTFNVIVSDATAPVIAGHGNVTAEATSAAGAMVTYTPPTTSDAVDGAGLASCGPAPGSTFAIGQTPVTCNATDGHNNAATPTSFTVTVSDTTPPVVTISVIGSPYEQTSAAGAVGTFTASAIDLVDGTRPVTCTATSGATFPRGTTNVSCQATDAHGNARSTTAAIVVQDTIQPLVTYSGQSANYASEQNVSITCSASDSGSGVASSTCANITGPAYSFGSGAHTFSASATDVAGNTGSGSVTFTVTTTLESAQALVNQFVTSNAGVVSGLNSKLAQIATATNANARTNALNAFINQVNGQIGKTLTQEQAAILIAQAQLL